MIHACGPITRWRAIGLKMRPVGCLRLEMDAVGEWYLGGVNITRMLRVMRKGASRRFPSVDLVRL
jgi:hypothetical protein